MAKKPVTAEAQGTAVVPASDPMSNLPAEFLEQIAKDSGMGNENIGLQDVAVPYFAVLQGLSPQVQDGHAKYIEGARPGMILNTASGEIYDGKPGGQRPFIFVPCSYERKFIEWLDRDTASGGYVGEHDIDSDILTFCSPPDERGFVRLKSDPNHIIVETAYHYGLAYSHDNENWEGGILSLKSTQLKVNRNWNHAITRQTVTAGGRTLQAPRWFFGWRFETVLTPSKRDANKTYYSLLPIRLEQPVTPDVYRQARDFNELIKSGVVKRDVNADAPTPATSGGGDPDDNIPF